MHKQIRGVHAAVLTPRLRSGEFDDRAMRHTIKSLMACGVDGVVVNGATGEYPRTEPDEFPRMLRAARDAAGPGRFIAGIGSSDAQRTLDFGTQAMAAGAAAVLLPAPHFFQYTQEDIAEYCGFIASRLEGTVLLYNLPQFTNGFELRTVQLLLNACPTVNGIKDSSGSLAILRALTSSSPRQVIRIVGSDAVLIQARQERLYNAVISGVAGVLPELILRVGGDGVAAGSGQYQEAARLLDEVLQRLHECPVPWGLKWMAERRGVAIVETPYPLSRARGDQRKAFQLWFDDWLTRAVPVLEMAEALG